ncbi:MAG TPA: 4-hydroxy-3-methylbut-2-enyl diphosphate reductase [Candidatus Omnitrophota bacterium]|nr:4-hydroxy-3-methylbut-2-enyl diphosphate reductase [Candidatus Omnitrophota bacterium]HPS37205.1 4-hydroxy-3-methylbut-2-enyl diphosphate reductase [Candidatus Omnitrophota bacterium]
MKEPEKIVRGSFGLKDRVRPQLDKSYHSPLIEKIRAEGFRLDQGRLEIRLAKEFGFCYGVERAVEYAYETRARFPDHRIFLINEIIHNPRVNAELQQMGIKILTGDALQAEITRKDVVIMPAFGVPLEDLKRFQKIGCVIVDTTCGSVMSVWRRVESYGRDGFTAVIHGKYDHEETRATCSRTAKYLVVKDKKEAERVCGYIRGAVSRGSFLEVFKNACSPGFDPDKDLMKIGFANQTTMLSSESAEISDLLRVALRDRYGAPEAKECFRHFDTICSATQDRQDAVRELGYMKMDLILVVGGYKSSNTGHLAEIASEFCPAYQVEDAACLISAETICHKKAGSSEVLETRRWLPEGKIRVGITAGASTPNRVVGEVIERLIEIAAG